MVSCCWRRVEVWAIALLLVVGGGFAGYQLAQFVSSKAYLEQVAEVRKAYEAATEQRDLRLDELARQADAAAAKATKAATAASDKADETLSRVSP